MYSLESPARAFRVDRQPFAELLSKVSEDLLPQLLNRHDELLSELGLLYLVHREGDSPTPDFGAKMLSALQGQPGGRHPV